MNEQPKYPRFNDVSVDFDGFYFLVMQDDSLEVDTGGWTYPTKTKYPISKALDVGRFNGFLQDTANDWNERIGERHALVVVHYREIHNDMPHLTRDELLKMINNNYDNQKAVL